jgi:hypothetical protein
MLFYTVRPTAQQLLEHPWFSQAGEDGTGSVLPEGNMSHVVARLEAFAGMSRMKRLALSILCHTVTDRHITRLKVRSSADCCYPQLVSMSACVFSWGWCECLMLVVCWMRWQA